MSKVLSKLKNVVANHHLAPRKEETWIRFGITTFNKTRFSSHRLFLKKCIKEKVIPKGFQLKFNQGPGQFPPREYQTTLYRCSLQLMRDTLHEYDKRTETLSRERSQLKIELQEISSTPEYRELSATVHVLNRDLYVCLDDVKSRKFSDIHPPLPEIDDDVTVVKIPETISLTNDEINLLNKGLSFVPRAQKIDPFKTLDDAENFYRKVRLTAYFETKDEEDRVVPEKNDFNMYHEKLNIFTPKPGQFEGVDTFINGCRKAIKTKDLLKTVEQNNVNPGELAAIRTLKERQDIIIKEADKGGAVCVWRKDLYVAEGEKQLGDAKFYKQLEGDITNNIHKDVTSVISKLVDTKDLPQGAKSLIVRAPRCALFYLLPKIHKIGIPGRPVVSNVSCPTYLISKYLSNLLKPLVRKCPTYIKDTTDLLHKVASFKFDNDSPDNCLFTMDIKGLYTNIPNGDGLNALKHYLDTRDNPSVSTTTLVRLAELVLKQNCFEFNGKYFSQINGTMMGTPFGVEYSCLAVAYQEKMIFEQYTGEKPILYLRYIDDVFGISTLPKGELDIFLQYVQDFHPSLKYTCDVAKEVNVLDTKLKVVGVCVESTLYCKPTDTHSYLQYDSSHPTTCKNNIPYSQYLRVRRICSNVDEYDKQSAVMTAHFVKQGYPRAMLERHRNKAKQTDRNTLLEKVSSQDKSNRIVLPITYHPINVGVTKVVKHHFKDLQTDEVVGHVFKDQPMIAYRKDKNLKDLLVRARIPGSIEIGGTSKCNRSRCLTCHHVNSDKTVVGPKGIFNVNSNFTCTSAGVVYCIVCNRCGELYVGETGRRLADRFTEHRRDVLKKSKDREVADHFNGAGHQGVADMTVLGLAYCNKVMARKLLEGKIIAKLGCVLGRGMNTDFHFPMLLQDNV